MVQLCRVSVHEGPCPREVTVLPSSFLEQYLRTRFKRIAYYLPPFLSDAIRYVFSDWEYCPQGWPADPGIKGWNHQSVAIAQEKHWPILVHNLEGRGPLGVSHFPTSLGRDDRGDHNTMMSYAYVLALAAKDKNKLTILDWGGGLGHYYLYSKALLPDVRIEYHCYDLPNLCRVGKELLPEARFYDSTAGLFEKQYDVVISSSSLHYCKQWQEVFHQLASVAGRFLYIARLQTILREPSFVVVQKPHHFGYYTQYPSWFLNRQEVLRCAENSGMELLREFVFAEEWFVKRAPEKGESRGFLFRRMPKTDQEP
jgi:putative methyltransferase (TIGR04325 family)